MHTNCKWKEKKNYSIFQKSHLDNF